VKKYSVLMFLYLVSTASDASDMNIQKKYPNTLLTSDYGILNVSDFQVYNSSTEVGLNSWQCFPTSEISVRFEKLGYDPDSKLNFATLKITVYRGNIVHEYELKRGFPVNDCRDMQNLWASLMKNQKHVCIGGSYVDQHERAFKGKKQQIYGWVFDRMKTKKGCGAYFKTC
jgi:hypothetical protein